MTNDVINIRVFYSKISRAKYISHLDVTRCMQRAIKRAGIPVWYTEGFNPHIYITFALPLSLGYESTAEIMDMRLVTPMDFEEVKQRLNAALPADIQVSSVALQKNKPEVITKANYKVVIHNDTFDIECLERNFNEFITCDIIEVSKKSKKGQKKLMKQIDIRPDFSVNSITKEQNGLVIDIDCASGIMKNLNPSLLFDEFKRRYGCEILHVSVLKTALFDAEGNHFE